MNKNMLLIVCEGSIPRPLVRKRGMGPETDSLPKQHTPPFMAGLLIVLLGFVFSGCAATRNLDGTEFAPATIRIPNRARTLGMIGENIESIFSDVATGVVPPIRTPLIRRRIRVTSVGEGFALLFVSNHMAQVAIISIEVLPTGKILHEVIKFTDQTSSPHLIDTTWSIVHEEGLETMQFISCTRGVYTFTDSSGASHSSAFNYIVSEDNEILIVFVAGEITAMSGSIFEDSMVLLSMGDENKAAAVFTRDGGAQ